MSHIRPISEKNKNLRHFSRHKKKCKVEPAEGCNYPKKKLAPQPPEAAKAAGWKSRFQNHHLIPTSCLKKFEAWDTYRKYIQIIRAIYLNTEWCASRSENLIRIPSDIDARRRAGPIKLPAHNRDHWSKYGYNDQVTIDLHAKIWMKAKKAKDEKLCDDEKFTGDVLAALEGIETERRKKVIACGKEGSSMVGKKDRIDDRDALIARLKEKEKEAKKGMSEKDKNNMLSAAGDSSVGR